MEEIAATHNNPALSVAELSNALKRVVENSFDHVRVRGEISGCKIASSGHVYFDLKDEKAVLNTICWRGIAAKLPVMPENGMEVICTGRISTYAGRSNYQLIVEYVELSGAGALAAMLEKRKEEFIKEGLFLEKYKKDIPYLPQTIGIITSPSGAVIRDILHRLNDRFPVKVLVWGVLVQGRGAETQIADAITGFNKLSDNNIPDLLIVARGGGSMEDLWCFNETAVVRAAFASKIPLISAIGHETDFTLLDFVADKRAPTPTAAAEMAVPVRSELILTIDESARRLKQQVFLQLNNYQEKINLVARGLISPKQSVEMRMQRLDEWGERLQIAFLQLFNNKQKILIQYATNLNINTLQQKIENADYKLQILNEKIAIFYQTYLDKLQYRLDALIRILEGLSHQSVLKRGYAYLSKIDSQETISKIAELKKTATIEVHLQDGSTKMTIKENKPEKRKIPKDSQPKLI